MTGRFSANRLVQMAVLSAVALALLFLVRPQVSDAVAFVVAVAPLVTWVLGKRYERAIVLDAGLVDEEELSAAERAAARYIGGSE